MECQGLSSLGEVALRSNDGEVYPKCFYQRYGVSENRRICNEYGYGGWIIAEILF